MSGVSFDPITHCDMLNLRQDVLNLQSAVTAARQEIAAVKTAASGSVVKSVQRGWITLATADEAKAATISAVDMSKAEARLLGVYQSDPNATNAWAALELSSPTTVRARRQTSGGVVGHTVTVSFEVTEYH